MTTTTTAAREAAKNLAIYNAIAEHARRAFETLEILPGQYTPAQVADLLKKSRAHWNDDDTRREVARVEVEGFACSFLLADVFAVLAQVATAYEIPTAARVTFERAAETAPAVVSFTITKTAAAEVAKAVAKKDPDRAAMEFAYIDTDRRALVGANGRVLTVAPLSSLSVAEGARPGYLVARCLLKADGVTIDTNNNATDGVKVAESPDWLRFPAWSSVFPTVYDTDALTIDAKTRRELTKAVATATKFAGEELNGCRLVSIFGEGHTSKIVISSRREVAAPTADDPTATRYDVRDTFIQLPAELSRSFALTFHGPDFAALPAFEKMYITPDAGRPAVFAGSHAVALLIPQSLPDTAERVCSTDSRPAWAKAVDPLADLLAAAPAADRIETPAAETITPAEVAAPDAVTIETPATADSIESEAETIETPAAPAADSIESEGTDTPAAVLVPVVFVDVCETPANDDTAAPGFASAPIETPAPIHFYAPSQAEDTAAPIMTPPTMEKPANGHRNRHGARRWFQIAAAIVAAFLLSLFSDIERETPATAAPVEISAPANDDTANDDAPATATETATDSAATAAPTMTPPTMKKTATAKKRQPRARRHRAALSADIERETPAAPALAVEIATPANDDAPAVDTTAAAPLSADIETSETDAAAPVEIQTPANDGTPAPSSETPATGGTPSPSTPATGGTPAPVPVSPVVLAWLLIL